MASSGITNAAGSMPYSQSTTEGGDNGPASSDPNIGIMNRIADLQNRTNDQTDEGQNGQSDVLAMLQNYMASKMGNNMPGPWNNPNLNPQVKSINDGRIEAPQGGGAGAFGVYAQGQSPGEIMQRLQEHLLQSQIDQTNRETQNHQAAVDAAHSVLKLKAPWLLQSLTKDPRNQVY